MTPANIHADAMKRSANLYDSQPYTHKAASCLGSNSPGVWLTFACLSGGIWGAETELTRHACAVADSYGFRQRNKVLRYPVEGPRNSDGEQVFLEVKSYETRSLVIKTLENVKDSNPAVFTGARIYDPRPLTKAEAKVKADADIRSKPRVKKDTKPIDKYIYELVSEDELDSLYAGYVAGMRTADEVMEAITNFVQRKRSLGNNEHGLRTRGADDLLGDFWPSISKAVTAKRYNGVTFSHYVNKAWCNLRNSKYKSVKKTDALFMSSTLTGRDEEDVGGNVTTRAVSIEDAHAVDLHDQMDEAADARREAERFVSTLKGVDLQIAEDLLAGIEQQETANRVKLSRHSVRRRQQKLKRMLQAQRTYQTEQAA